jgi:small-conductance mechanosensitive channel
MRAVSAAVLFAGVALWVQVVLEVLPWSRPLARSIYRYGAAPLRTLWSGFQSIVPNLFYLAVIALVTFSVLKVVRIVFKEIEVGSLRFASFPSDWAEPTYKLVRALLLAVALVGAFPYIPGSQSPAFQGISLFLGLLVSLSSSSALSNIIAGTILTYTRAFKLGDIVRIGDTLGEVTIKRLLVTHVRTYKNVVVSIPNSVILATQVLNYTTLAAEHGLVLHTSVTIGYDAPWPRVHELLVAAATRTDGVMAEPPPFVLQTALNDFSVEYEINAFVSSARPMPLTYSALHTNIQQCFNEGGVEIMSPNYFALRDGNQVTTPKQYLPSDYLAPAFRVRQGDEHELLARKNRS